MNITNLSVKKEQTDIINVKKVYPDKAAENMTAECVNEHKAVLIVNERAVMNISCLQSDMELLAVGRLLSEGYISNIDEVESIYICEEALRIKVFLKHDIIFHEKIMDDATCCSDNRSLSGFEAVSMLPFEKRKEAAAKDVFSLAKAAYDNFGIHKRTSGTHICYLMCSGKIAGVYEDISRHNALDKAIGFMAVNGLSPSDCMVFTTGRVPCDMVKKVIYARIPVIVSKAVPTKQAALMAAEYGLTLICRAWPDSYEIVE